jgi:O-acetyl-ADP-ribose deacetylase (regulator of RNase III)
MEYIKKDVTTVTRGVIAHGVNCKGVMGSGVAKAIRDKWPLVYDEYRKWQPDAKLLGQCQFVPVNQNIWVANCFTQNAYGRNPNVKYASPHAIANALQRAMQFACENESPFYMPPIGCGLGGLSWNLDVRNIVEELERKYLIEVYICDI